MNEFTSLRIPDWEFIHKLCKDNNAPAYSISKQFLNFELLIEVNQTEMKKAFCFCLLLSAVKKLFIHFNNLWSWCIDCIFSPCSVAFFRTQSSRIDYLNIINKYYKLLIESGKFKPKYMLLFTFFKKKFI